MGFMQLAKDRYSLRKFSAKPISDETLTEILEAGRLAPSGCNLQPQRILVIRKPEALDALDACMRYRYGAQLALLVCYDKNVSWKSKQGKDVGEIDASIVITHMMLAAQELGVGSLWVGDYDEPLLIEKFAVPENLVPVSLLVLGYPAEGARPHPKLHDVRFGLEHTVFYDTFPEEA